MEGAAQASGQSTTEDLHRTLVIRLLVLFHAFIVKEGFKYWVVGKKVVSFRSKSACTFDPSLLVRRVFFPTTNIIMLVVMVLVHVHHLYLPN